MQSNIYKVIIWLLLFQSCVSQKNPEANLEAKKHVLLGEWRVSHEENKEVEDGEMIVWRRPSYTFPPSRFRKKYILADSSQLKYLVPGPADRPEWKAGFWKLQTNKDSYWLIIQEETGAFTAEIVTLDAEKLELKKHKK